MEKHKCKEINLQQKIALINESNGKSQRQLAEQFGIGKTQVKIRVNFLWLFSGFITIGLQFYFFKFSKINFKVSQKKN